MRSVREEESVRLAVNDAEVRWDRAEDAWQTITWTLARDPEAGEPLNGDGSLRSFVYDGARSIKLPSVDVIYSFDPQYVTIWDARFYDSPHRYTGHG